MIGLSIPRIGFLQPSALWFLALVPIIFLFYILRARHQQQHVPSIRFWRNISSDLEGRPSWRMPLTSPLLLLQLLTVVVLALALARPAILGGTKRHLILVLDASVTMQATDVLPNRFEAAKRQARDLIGELTAADAVTLVRAARGPLVLAAAEDDSDRAAVLDALDAASPSGAPSDMLAALALGSSLASQHAGARNEIAVLSDGAFPKVDLARLGSPLAELKLHLVGVSARNVAVTELSVRPLLGTVGRNVAFARVANEGDEPADVPMRVLADGIAIDNRRLKLPAGGAAELTVNLPTGSKLVEARIEGADYQKLDDQAQVLVPTDQPIAVTLVSTNTVLWDRVFRALPLVKVTKVRPSAYRPTPADVTVFDGFTPPISSWPAGGGILVVNPQPSTRTGGPNPPFPIVGESGPVQVTSVAADSPLLEGVDLGSVALQKSIRLRLPDWGHPVAESAEGPLIFDGQVEGSRAVVFAFDPSQSELPQRLAYPILIANTISYLTPADLPRSVRPGEIVDIPPISSASEIVVQLPSGRGQAFVPKGGPIRFGQTDAPGIYVVTQRMVASGGAPTVLSQHSFIVSSVDEQASDIRPHPDALGVGLPGPSGTAPGVEQETWPALAAVALALLFGEWLYYCRRR